MAPVLRVLYVDDEPTLLEIGKRFLERETEFRVDIIPSALHALALLGQKHYDAIISDYQMPGMDGIGFLKAVRASGNDIPFILFTGRGREEIVITALNEGADFYLQKGGETKSQFAELAHKIRQASGKRRAEQALIDSQKRLEDIINFLPDATFAIDRSGCVIAWNRAIEEMTGVAAQDILGKGDYAYALPFYDTRRKILIDLIFEPDEVIARDYSRIIHQKDLLIAETTLPRPQGREVTLLGKASPLYDPEGNIVGAIESIRDITDLRKAELSLRESERRYREVVETQTEFICRFQPDGTYVFVNEAYCRHFKKTREEIIGHRFVPFIPEEDRERLRKYFASFTPDQPSGESEHRVTLPDGSVRWHWWNDLAIFDNEGRIIEFQSIGKDITDRKRVEEDLRQSENLYRTIFDYTGAASIIIGPDTTILRANRGWEILTGMPRGEQENKLSWTVFFNAEDTERMKGYHYARRKDPEGVPDIYESRLVDATGHTHDVFVHVGMIPGSNNSVASLVDISERRKAEDDLRQAYENLAAAEEQLRAQFEELKTSEQKVRRSEKDYRSILENIQDVYYRTDTAGNLLSASPSLADVLGYSPVSSLYGKDIATSLYANPDDRTVFLEDLEKTGSVTNYEVLLKHRDGTLVTVITSSHKYFDDDGRFLGVEGIFRDITERKRVEEALRRTEERFRAFTENIEDLTAITDEEGRYTYVSPSVFRLSGYTPEEVLGRNATGTDTPFAIHPDDLGRLVEASHKARQTPHQPVQIAPFRRTMSNGQVIYIEGSVTYLPDVEGIQGSLFHGRDVTDRIQAEAALQASEERYRSIVDAHTEMIARFTPDGTITFVNEAYHAYFKPWFGIENIVGTTIRELMQVKNHEAVEQFLSSLTVEEPVRDMERVVTGSDGKTYWQLWTVKAIFGPDRQVVEYQVNGRDITDRKKAEDALRESEERYSAIVNHAPGPVVITRREEILYVNDAGVQASGYSREELTGKSILGFLTADSRKAALDAMDRRGAGTESITEYEVDFIRKDGDTLNLIVRAIDISYKGENVTLSLLVNITDRKRAEKALVAANRKLGLLTEITRHDIRNQLLVLAGFIELSRRSRDDPACLADLSRKATETITAISALIGFTKDYEKLGVQSPAWQNVWDLTGSILPQLPLGTIRVERGDPSLEVFADPLLVRVFYNLFGNALRYGGEQMTTIRITDRREGANLIISVEDDGVGISAGDKGPLFTRGYGKNTGLGLFLSREILAITGITIAENSEPGKGARFEITVPDGAWRYTGKK